MSNEHEYYFGLAMFEKLQTVGNPETYFFSRQIAETRFVFEIRTHMETHWRLSINGSPVPCADIITAETLKHMLIGFGFLKENKFAFFTSVTTVYP